MDVSSLLFPKGNFFFFLQAKILVSQQDLGKLETLKEEEQHNTFK